MTSTIEASRGPIVFPSEFTWGVATSAYQIEGAWRADGKGESIWDRFTHAPGNVHEDQNGDIACDHYHRWPEDVQLMAELGVDAYRFSVSWPRILPKGFGEVDQAGLDFYKGLVDGLLAQGIEPYLTLYHWDLPQVLQDRGGWPARATTQAFAEYADVLSRSLGDRVRHWITLNEPFVSAHVGHLQGRHAPGHMDLAEMVAASHHLLLAHGLAVPILRGNVTDARVAIVLDLHPVHPASDSEADQEAARRWDGTYNRWYLDPLSGRGYPQDMVDDYGQPLDFVQEGDLEKISAPLDALGVNYYTRNVVRSDEVPEAENEPRRIPEPETVTEMGWEVYPPGLFEVLQRVEQDYGFPAYWITENGAAFPDQVNADGEVLDQDRIDYLDGHLRQLARALGADLPVDAYFAWSLLDNFEWGHGYSKRFGLVYVDFDTLERTPKASYHWYRRLIKTGQLPPGD